MGRGGSPTNWTFNSDSAATACASIGCGTGAMTNITSSLTVSGCSISGNKCVVGTAGTTITLSAIPSTYADLIVRIFGENDQTGAENVIGTFNGDATTSDYGTYLTYGITNAPAGGINEANTLLLGNLNGSSPANGMGAIDCLIPGYSNTTFTKTMYCVSEQYNGLASGIPQNLAATGQWNGSSSITSLTLTIPPTFKFIVGTTVRVLGVQ